MLYESPNTAISISITLQTCFICFKYKCVHVGSSEWELEDLQIKWSLWAVWFVSSDSSCASNHHWRGTAARLQLQGQRTHSSQCHQAFLNFHTSVCVWYSSSSWLAHPALGAVMDPPRESGCGGSLQSADGGPEWTTLQRGWEAPSGHHGCKRTIAQTVHFRRQAQCECCSKQGKHSVSFQVCVLD